MPKERSKSKLRFQKLGRWRTGYLAQLVLYAIAALVFWLSEDFYAWLPSFGGIAYYMLILGLVAAGLYSLSSPSTWPMNTTRQAVCFCASQALFLGTYAAMNMLLVAFALSQSN